MVEMCSPSVHLYSIMASPSRSWWRGSWTGRCRSELEVGHLRAVRQRSSYGFPSNKFVNVWACTSTHYEKYPSGIMIVRLGLSSSGAIIIPL